MKPRIIFIVSVLGMLIGMGLPAKVSNAQTAKDVVGTWTLVSVEAAGADGSKSQPYGANPVGIIIFDASGHYSNLTSRGGLPKFASNNRTQGRPEENRAIVQGSIAHFGKYSVSKADKAIIFHIEKQHLPQLERGRAAPLIHCDRRRAEVRRTRRFRRRSRYGRLEARQISQYDKSRWPLQRPRRVAGAVSRGSPISADAILATLPPTIAPWFECELRPNQPSLPIARLVICPQSTRRA